MLETIRSFALERLEADGQAMEMRRRHAEYFADFAESAMPHLIASDRAAWLDRVQDDHDNLRAAITFAVETGDAHLGMRLVYALWRFWQSRAHLQEGAERTAAVLAIPTDELRTELRARAFEAGGGIAYWRGRLEQGRTYYDAALDIARELGDRHLIADALYNGAMVRNVLEVNPAATVEESLAMLDEAIRLYRATGDDVGAARALWGLGTAQYFSSDWRVAADTFRAAEEGLRGSDDEFMRGWVLHMLGSTEIRLGQLDPALEHITRRDAEHARGRRDDRHGPHPRRLRRPRRRHRRSGAQPPPRRRRPGPGRCDRTPASPPRPSWSCGASATGRRWGWRTRIASWRRAGR